MYGIYANIWGIWMGSMLPYIAAPWIRHGYDTGSEVFGILTFFLNFIPSLALKNLCDGPWGAPIPATLW